MKKPENVTIRSESLRFEVGISFIQIGPFTYEPKFLAIGSDDKIYVWLHEEGDWYLYIYKS